MHLAMSIPGPGRSFRLRFRPRNFGAVVARCSTIVELHVLQIAPYFFHVEGAPSDACSTKHQIMGNTRRCHYIPDIELHVVTCAPENT